MTEARYVQLMTDINLTLTWEEIDAGWHWCGDFDGLLVGPGTNEQQYCTCAD